MMVSQRRYFIYICYYGDHDELYFRDHMDGNQILAKEYDELKLSLSKDYKINEMLIQM